ncbi:9602_t:CDS:2 [Ambispora leptoticha]|uniref:9602_t:CDS:1 n=1 Tax=Ambispora leptoticha TaxID=144679 RepID=A0A9N9B852_9GLOM|nr:9602_t:CDS:2 [Ambispora leptoticha]
MAKIEEISPEQEQAQSKDTKNNITSTKEQEHENTNTSNLNPTESTDRNKIERNEKEQEQTNDNENENETTPKFTPQEIKELIQEANLIKSHGNELFSNNRYEDAIQQYQKALDTCPVECRVERAVFWGNIGACEIKLENYNRAVDACNKALEDSPNYTKVRLRRAQINEKIGSHSSLVSAQEDYNLILTTYQKEFNQLPHSTQKSIESSLSQLPQRIAQAQEREKEEMISKFKDLGNTLLGKFGLSTDNFSMVKNEESGGYSIQFNNTKKSDGDSNDT